MCKVSDPRTGRTSQIAYRISSVIIEKQEDTGNVLNVLDILCQGWLASEAPIHAVHHINSHGSVIDSVQHLNYFYAIKMKYWPCVWACVCGSTWLFDCACFRESILDLCGSGLIDEDINQGSGKLRCEKKTLTQNEDIFLVE